MVKNTKPQRGNNTGTFNVVLLDKDFANNSEWSISVTVQNFVSANEFIISPAWSPNNKNTSNNQFALGPTEVKWNLYARRQPVKGTGGIKNILAYIS